MARRRKQPDSPPPRESTYEKLEDLEGDGSPSAFEAINVPKHIRDYSRNYTKEAALFYAKYARDTSQPASFRKACYDELMNRAWGRPRDEGDLRFDGVVEVRFTKKEAPGASNVIDVVAQAVAEIADERPLLLDAMQSETADVVLSGGAIVPVSSPPETVAVPAPTKKASDDS